jgi:hypothetical protein
MKKVLAISIIAVVAFVLWRGSRRAIDPADDRRGEALFYGRAWLDHAPASPTENFFVFGTSKKHPLGWFAERAIWKGQWERFRYARRGDGRFVVEFPHTGRKLELTYRAWACKENGFDYCLELTGAGGPTRYYSRRGWDRDDLDPTAFLDEPGAGSDAAKR